MTCLSSNKAHEEYSAVKSGVALPLALLTSISEGNHPPSGGPYSRLPTRAIKIKNELWNIKSILSGIILAVQTASLLPIQGDNN